MRVYALENNWILKIDKYWRKWHSSTFSSFSCLMGRDRNILYQSLQDTSLSLPLTLCWHFHLSGVWQENPVHVVMLNCQSFDCSFAWALRMKIDVLISSFEARMSKSVSLGIYSVRLFSSKLKISCWCIFKLNWMNISRVTTFRKFCQTKPLSSPSFFFFFLLTQLESLLKVMQMKCPNWR